jgi:outer membrane usher protein
LEVEIAGTSIIPAYGQIIVMPEGTEVVSPVGKSGEFYLENLPAGRHPAKIEFKQGVCAFVLEIPASEGAFVNLWTLRCVIP